jgi:sphinganine C4-monooxygenase
MEFISGEELVVMLAPVAVYWVYSGMYEALGSSKALDKYRLHSRRDEVTKNMASKKDVVKGVLLQQAIQAAISVAVLKVSLSLEYTSSELHRVHTLDYMRFLAN